MRPAWLEIDLDAIDQNLHEIGRMVGPQVGITAVVKCNAYGHGAVPVARTSLVAGAKMLAVALLQEAAELRDAGIAAPILVLGATDPEEAEEFVAREVCASLATVEFAQALSAAAVKRRQPGRCHIKVDSGMGRQGVRADEVPAFAQTLSGLAGLQVEGIFSHFACGPEEPDFTEAQRVTFLGAVAEAERVLGQRIPLRHLANTCGIIGHPDAYLDAVRPGALMYGIAAGQGTATYPGTRQAMTLKAKITTVKRVGKGESVGYDRTFVAERDTCIAVMPVGYGDGYLRTLENKADVLIRGQRCPVVGRVSMDCITVDVGGVPDVSVGDEVVLLGGQGDEMITVPELAQRAGTIVQEVVACMSARLPRVYASAGPTPEGH